MKAVTEMDKVLKQKLSINSHSEQNEMEQFQSSRKNTNVSVFRRSSKVDWNCLTDYTQSLVGIQKWKMKNSQKQNHMGLNYLQMKTQSHNWGQ